MLVPYPADQVVGVVLVLGKPELAFFANDVENLWYFVSIEMYCKVG